MQQAGAEQDIGNRDIRTRQGEEGRQLTGVVVDGLGITEIQANSQEHNDKFIETGQAP